MNIALTRAEIGVLDKIAKVSKMDCWFALKYTKSKGWQVFDLEANKAMSLRKGVSQLIDGMIELNYDALTDAERFILIKLCGWLLG